MFGESEIKKVLDKRSDLQRQIDEIDQWLELGKKLVGVQDSIQPQKASPKSKRGVTPSKVLIAACLEIVQGSPNPVPGKALMKAIEDKGYIIGGQNPVQNLSAKLSQTESIVALRGFGYWPAEKPYGPAGYYPEPEKERKAGRPGLPPGIPSIA